MFLKFMNIFLEHFRYHITFFSSVFLPLCFFPLLLWMARGVIGGLARALGRPSVSHGE